MKIAIYEIQDWEADYLKAKLSGNDLVFYAGPFSETSPPDEDADIISPFVGSFINKNILEKSKKLKYVATRSTGFDHIDIAACAEKGVKVSNVPAYGDNTVAEYAFTLLLGLSRKLYQSVKRVREDNWFNFEGLRGFDLKGKTIGIVGTGRIGAYAARIAQGFGMEIVAYDPFPNQRLVNDYGVKYLSLNELLSVSDVVSLHVPYMPSTHHIINKENIQHFKKGAVLINTARGGLVETESLLLALKSGILAGAALDVLEEEGLIKDEMNLLLKGHPSERELKNVLVDHELMHMENVIVTPHNAFNTIEALKRILDTTIENILSFVAGEPINVVTNAKK